MELITIDMSISSEQETQMEVINMFMVSNQEIQMDLINIIYYFISSDQETLMEVINMFISSDQEIQMEVITHIDQIGTIGLVIQMDLIAYNIIVSTILS